MGLPKTGRFTACFWQFVLVLLKECAERLLRWRRNLTHNSFNGHRHSLDRRRLLQAAKIVPPPAWRIARKTSLKQHEHIATNEFGTERFKKLLLRYARGSKPQSRNDAVKLFDRHKIVGPLGKKIVDCCIAHNEAVFSSLRFHQRRANNRLLVLWKQR